MQCIMIKRGHIHVFGLGVVHVPFDGNPNDRFYSDGIQQ